MLYFYGAKNGAGCSHPFVFSIAHSLSASLSFSPSLAISLFLTCSLAPFHPTSFSFPTLSISHTHFISRLKVHSSLSFLSLAIFSLFLVCILGHFRSPFLFLSLTLFSFFSLPRSLSPFRSSKSGFLFSPLLYVIQFATKCNDCQKKQDPMAFPSLHPPTALIPITGASFKSFFFSKIRNLAIFWCMCAFCLTAPKQKIVSWLSC